jgi:predicted alpha/beta-hydrolase family hydrolase
MSPGLKPRPAGLLLTPGAGAASDHPSLLAVEAALVPLGLVVQRIDFDYRRAGRRRPDPAPVLEFTVRQQAQALADRLGVEPGRLLLGGRSMGGRICSQVVAGGWPAAGLVLISYPLHPPGRPERLRTGHLDAIKVPCLFVSGTRDAFGLPEELHEATRLIPGQVTHRWIEGGDHSLRRRHETAADLVAGWWTDTWG